ncbi:hypothetical protein AGMMS49949_01410 [Alphaproteobacteria bacterium]|nr:hypothetical protein AGMMS49949_01410 [Alphaproteobacteria bacterium]GHS97071.1 hypothetical protein AGMMS50296_3740 [Alphaproteobacteria bacterium]
MYAWKLKKLPAFCDDTLEDLQQDLLLEVFEAWKLYDPDKGTPEKFAENVLKKRAANRLHKQFRLKKPTRLRRVSLQSVSEEDLSDFSPWDEDLSFKIGVEKLLQKMPALEGPVFNQLRLDSLRQTARTFGFSRGKLQILIEKNRPYFAPLAEFISNTDFLVNRIGRRLCVSL